LRFFSGLVGSSRLLFFLISFSGLDSSKRAGFFTARLPCVPTFAALGSSRFLVLLVLSKGKVGGGERQDMSSEGKEGGGGGGERQGRLRDA
jgi:hypothetical protein